MPTEDLVVHRALERKVLCISIWIVHKGNLLRDAGDWGMVGSHRASSASKFSRMTATNILMLRITDRITVRPHEGPVPNAVQFLLGYLSRKSLLNFGEFEGAQSYPSRTRDGGDADLSARPVRPDVETTAFAIIAQDHVRACPGTQRASRSRYRFRAAKRLEN